MANIKFVNNAWEGVFMNKNILKKKNIFNIFHLFFTILFILTFISTIFAKEIADMSSYGELKEVFSKLSQSYINNVVPTSISSDDCEYIYKNAKIANIKLKKDSALGKALINSHMNLLYDDIANDSNFIKLKNGFFNIQYNSSGFYYALDQDGNILTGFVNSENKRYFELDGNGNLITKDTTEDAIYYLIPAEGIAYGTLNNSPISIDGMVFNFDEQGRLEINENNIPSNLNSNLSLEKDEDITDSLIPTMNSDISFNRNTQYIGNWEYNQDNFSWYYYIANEQGTKTYLKNGAYKLHDNKFYMFDDTGRMKTGLIKYNSNTYYFKEYGADRGSLYTGKIHINGIPYEFDEQGIMISSMNKKMHVTSKSKYAK